MPDPMEPLRNVTRTIKDAAKDLGLTVHHVGFVPGDDFGDVDTAQIMFEVDTDKLTKTDEELAEQAGIDSQFADLEKQFGQQTTDDKSKEAEEGLKRLLGDDT